MKSRFILVFLAVFMLTAHARAASVLDHSNRFTVSYGIYAGGFQALAIDVAFDVDKTHYMMGMKAKPYGMLGRLLPWAGDYKTVGAVKKGLLVPMQHDRLSAWRDDTSYLIMSYKDGTLIKKEEIDNENGKTVKKTVPLEKGMHEGTLDLVSAVLDMLVKATDKKTCTYSQEIYDGKRRFRFTFKDEGTKDIAASAINIFKGPSRLCRMELIPLKGFKGKPRGYYRIQEEARAKGELPVIWLGQAWAGGPMIPVRMMIKSEYGTVFMHLQKVER